MRIISLLLFSLFFFGSTAEAQKNKKQPPKVEAKPTTLVVSCLTEGAKILIDDVEVGKTPSSKPFVVEPGKHTLKLSKRGFTTYADVFTAVLGKETKVEIDLFAIAGMLKVTLGTAEEAKGQIYLDGKYLGETPYDGDIPLGQKELEVRRLGSRDFRQSIKVQGGKEYNIAAKLEVFPDALNPLIDKGQAKLPPFWKRTAGQVTIGSVSLATIGSSIALGLFLHAKGLGCDGFGCRDETDDVIQVP